MDELRVERGEGVVQLTLDRPERRNALSIPMWEELARQLAEIQARDEDRVLVLTGAGGVFCAGGDLGGGRSDGDADGSRSDGLAILRSTVVATALALHALSKPTIAAVDGIAAGAGANLALGCDLVLASDRARFGQVFIRRALPLDTGGTWLLPRLVGMQKAKELAFFGDWVEAAEAERIGLVNRVLPHDGLLPFVQDYVRELGASCSPTSMRIMKRQVYTRLTSELGPAMDESIRLMVESFGRADFKEGVQSFLEKRPPRFQRI
jgi:enoyl-CoA hydratase/carnithine racemase